MTAATTLVDLFSISEPQNATNIKVDPIKKVGRTETISIYTILQDLCALDPAAWKPMQSKATSFMLAITT